MCSYVKNLSYNNIVAIMTIADADAAADDDDDDDGGGDGYDDDDDDDDDGTQGLF